jgi:hypothetical protein
VSLILRPAAVIAVLVIALLILVPQARALVAGWFRIGIINIVPESPPATALGPAFPATVTPGGPTGLAPVPTQLPPALRDLSGLTSLTQAQQEAGFRIRLPAQPASLGNPDLVFLQDALDLVVLAWLDPDDPQAVRLSLHEYSPTNTIVNKYDPTILSETTVHGLPALWVEGPYPLQVVRGDFEWMRIVEGRSLLWEQEGITFRLESLLSLDEALVIAESIR